MGLDKGSFDEEHKNLFRRLALRMIISSFLAQPLFILFGALLLPAISLSGLIYAMLGLSIALLFLSAQFLYAWSKDANPQFVKSAVYSLLVSFIFISVNDQVSIRNATTSHAAFLAYRYDLATEDLKTRLGVAAVALTGEDIYNGRCSACHLFDEKKIGPAYKDVIPKYGGDKARIMAFVMNPVKMNPAFPPMPNQGLKPAEADSIVSYILHHLEKTHPASSPPNGVPKK
jgi:cytochrome c